MNESAPLGEIIYTSTTEIIGQSQPGSAPFAYGSFILAGKHARAVGVVYNVETASADPNRIPVFLGQPEDEIPKHYPNTLWQLRPQIKALLIGRIDSDYQFGLPATPPPMHGEIVSCSAEQLRLIGRRPEFLHLVFSSGKSAMEELILGVCRSLLEAFDGERRRYAVRIGKAVSELYRDDYDTLRRVLERMEAWTN